MANNKGASDRLAAVSNSRSKNTVKPISFTVLSHTVKPISYSGNEPKKLAILAMERSGFDYSFWSRKPNPLST